MAATNNLDLDSDPKVIAGIRIFDAPRALVFSAFTDQQRLAQWWGPNGFTTTTHVKLNSALAAMGMPLAFEPQADFSAMSPAPMQVQSVVQRDYLSVGERGTEAAAATGISMMPTAAHVTAEPTITLDHPFLFLIRDTKSGTILFSSLVRSPTGS